MTIHLDYIKNYYLSLPLFSPSLRPFSLFHCSFSLFHCSLSLSLSLSALLSLFLYIFLLFYQRLQILTQISAVLSLLTLMYHRSHVTFRIAVTFHKTFSPTYFLTTVRSRAYCALSPGYSWRTQNNANPARIRRWRRRGELHSKC